MLPDVAGIDKVFDYLVSPDLDGEVRVGTLVRVPLSGRRVGGWVVRDGAGGAGADRAGGGELLAVAKVTGWGPPPAVVDLAAWAAWRWAGRRGRLLSAASPPVAVRNLPPTPGEPAPAPTTVVDREVASMVDRALSAPAAGAPYRTLRLPPATDPVAVVVSVLREGPALVLFPSGSDAAMAARRLRRAGVALALLPRDWPLARAGGVTVVGSRSAAWAPLPDPAAVVVMDGHDEGYHEQRSPTWHARDVAAERARRAGVPCLVVSPCPDLAMLAAGRPLVPSREMERSGWPVLDIVDRRRDDPRSGWLGPRLAAALRSHDRVVCVLNRKGRARLLACWSCGEVAGCERCGAAVVEPSAGGSLACLRCGATRPVVCLACGGGRMKALRKGVTRAREEIEALAGRPVGEVTAETAEVPDAPVLVGTEAVLHRVRRADAVAFLDFDQELLAPRYRAGEQALALLARAGRIVGGRPSGGRVLVQTRLPRHEVLLAALHGDPGRLADAQAPLRRDLGFPPYAALAVVSGPAAGELVGRLADVEVLGPDDGRWLVRAPDAATLADALAAAGRPAGRVRIEVDPLRI